MSWRTTRLIQSTQKVGHADVQRFGEGLDNLDGGISCGTLKIADIGSVDARFVGKRLLTERAGLTKTTQVSGKAVLDIHPSSKAPMSTNDLQTMSDIDDRPL